MCNLSPGATRQAGGEIEMSDLPEHVLWNDGIALR